MESSEQKRTMSQHDGERSGILPAMVSCAAGVIGLVVIAASPWLLLYSDAARNAAEQPAYQAARAVPSVAESKRIADDRLQQLGTAQHSDAKQAVISLAAGPREFVQ
jgi:hypothetical protein